MEDISSRIDRSIEEITGNEALLEMLETDAAIDMLNWAKAMVARVVQDTAGMDDSAAELALVPRLKAIRQSMRSIGNWAAGKYVDPADRLQLREKLLGHFRTIFGEQAALPSAEDMDAVLTHVDDSQNSPQQLIARLLALLPQNS